LLKGQQYYAIQLNTKLPTSYSLSSSQAFLTSKSIERKSRFNIPIDSTDLPVSNVLIDSISTLTSGTFITHSNWHNLVVFDINHSDTTLLKSQSFVTSFQFIGDAENNESTLLEEKFYTPTINDYPSNYNAYKQIEGLYLHGKDYLGDGITIAVFDNGFEGTSSNSYFSNNILYNKNLVFPSESYEFGGSHGTEVWSLISSTHPDVKGTAPNASYILLVTENTFKEHPLEMYHWARAAEIADSLGTDIINSSLGYFNFEDSQFNLPQNPNDAYPIISSAVSFARDKGILVVCSAGNEGSKDWQYVIYPANHPDAFAIGASSNIDTWDEFSSIGFPNGEIKPNILARGRDVEVVKLDGSVGRTIGTSFSAPIISGFTACLWQAFPDWNADTLRARIERSAHLYTNPTQQEGYGIPNFKAIYLKYSGEQDSSLNYQENIHIFHSEGQLHIENGFPLDIKLIELFDMKGSLVFAQNINTSPTNNFSFNLSEEIVQGTYICNITLNQSVIQRKIFIR
jgi:hypothetical protein